MTNREFFEAVKTWDGMSDEMVTKATELIKALDNRNAQRKGVPTKTQLANIPLIKEIAGILTTEPMLASEIAEKISTEEVKYSTQKAGALAKQVENVQVVDVKVKGKGTQKGYFLAE